MCLHNKVFRGSVINRGGGDTHTAYVPLQLTLEEHIHSPPTQLCNYVN